MSPDSIASIAAAIAAAGFGAWGARSARRTKRQETRDDFTAVTRELRTDLKSVKTELATQKADAALQQDQITGQWAAIRWLIDDRHSLVAHMRGAGMERPPSRPIPARARPFLDHIDG